MAIDADIATGSGRRTGDCATQQIDTVVVAVVGSAAGSGEGNRAGIRCHRAAADLDTAICERATVTASTDNVDRA